MKRILALLAVIASLLIIPATATATAPIDGCGVEQTAQETCDPQTEEPTTQAPSEKPSTAPPTEEPSTEPPTEEPSTEPPTEPPSEDVTTEPPSTEPPSTEPPSITAFDIEVCPLTGEPIAFVGGADYAAFDVAVIGKNIPAGKSAIRFRHPILAILLLKIRIDGQPVTLDGDGVVLVTPGFHTFSISNAADTEVLAQGTAECPECNPPDDVTQPPHHFTVPPSDTIAAATGSDTGALTPVLLVLAGLAITSLILTRKRTP